MSTNPETKINQLLQLLPQGTVLLASWLTKNGYSRELQHRYLKSGWLTSIGSGAMQRTGDTVDITGALYSLQVQAGKSVHIGGRTALGMQGLSHYLELYQKETLLFAPVGVVLPAWFTKNKWDTKPVLIHSSMLPPDIGLIDSDTKSYAVKISEPARALMECLELTPQKFDLNEAWQIMEGLSSLLPEKVIELLIQCNSVKVVRLFLFLAEKAGHSWYKYINTDIVNLGKGKRSIFPGGVYIPKYQITVPANLA
ncbi:MAG: type IV toxin-antitoxin system AbiEi family antitoxin [Lentimicrobiaceae bacterium]|jgi:hypothetical protein